jgi:hypothetical protein
VTGGGASSVQSMDSRPVNSQLIVGHGASQDRGQVIAGQGRASPSILHSDSYPATHAFADARKRPAAFFVREHVLTETPGGRRRRGRPRSPGRARRPADIAPVRTGPDHRAGRGARQTGTRQTSRTGRRRRCWSRRRCCRRRGRHSQRVR